MDVLYLQRLGQKINKGERREEKSERNRKDPYTYPYFNLIRKRVRILTTKQKFRRNNSTLTTWY